MGEVKYQNCPIEPDEMAEILYEMSTDMDYDDYGDTKEQDIKELTDVLDKVKDYGYYNADFELLFNALSNALFLERNLKKDWRKLANLLDDLNAKELEKLKKEVEI